VSKLISTFVTAFLLLAAPVRAAVFTLDSFNVNLHTTDPGLVLFEDSHLAPYTQFTLNNVGDSQTLTLFRIGTRETALNGDDLVPYDITVDFQLSTPPPPFGDTANGVTGAGWFLGSFGYVIWNNPLVMTFGNYGQLAISLENETFRLPGSTYVDATFTLLRADGGSTAVPEPASALLFGVGAVAIGVIRRRRPANR
jgi:PEP-CTERM motif-containing protein